MMYSLSNKGLTSSEAQFLSNLANQKVADLKLKLSKFSPYHTTLEKDGNEYNVTHVNPITTDVIDILKQISSLTSLQAFLRENMKEKDKRVRNIEITYPFIYNVKRPESEESTKLILESPLTDTEPNDRHIVGSGWEECLSTEEYNDFLKHQAIASEIGKYIHNGGGLAKAREQMGSTPLTEWETLPDNTSYLKQNKFDNSIDELTTIHEQLAIAHREAEKQVNYYKAKVKNFIANENREIISRNQKRTEEWNLQETKRVNEYENAINEYTIAKNVAEQEWRKEIIKKSQEISNLRIAVPEFLQETINLLNGDKN